MRTIMSVLGHSCARMSLVYAAVSDREVLRDYQSVIAPGAMIAGPFAEALKSGEVPQSAVEWLKSNFYKTDLELGHCCRLPQEGPCECDLFLFCPKFVTTSDHAPRLRKRRLVELELIEDANQRGWQKEVERHRRVVDRLETLLSEMNEAVEGRVCED